jgi:hypothetical protein
MLTRLDRLEEFDGGNARVLSVYLDLTPGRRARRTHQVAWGPSEPAARAKRLRYAPRSPKRTVPLLVFTVADASDNRSFIEGSRSSHHDDFIAPVSCA